MATQKFDQLNNRSIPFDRYFGQMRLAEDDKQYRMRIAEIIYLLVVDYLYELKMLITEGVIDIEFVRDNVIEKYEERIANVVMEDKGVDLDPVIETYLPRMLDWVGETTLNHADDPWMFTDDRATFISENEANTIANYEDYQTAVAVGCTQKTWFSMLDERVRDTHEEVDGTTIGINDFFQVGNSQMRYPHDIYGSPEEVINCRCTVVYS